MIEFHNQFVDLEYREYPLNEKFPIYALLNGEFLPPPTPLAELTFLHFHNCVEIGRVYEGSYQFYVEDTCFTLNKGDVFLLSPYTMHISLPDTADSVCEYLYLLPEILLKDFFPERIPDVLLPYQFQNFPILFSSAEHPCVCDITAEILSVLRNKAVNYDIAVKGLTMSLMSELSHSLPEHPLRNAGNKVLPFLTPAFRYINQHYDAHLSIDELAQMCHCSTSYFQKLFKQSTGTSPTSYIQKVRLSKACDLLHSTEDSILAIALSVGFQSVSNFNRQFQNLYHQTPRQWRNTRRSVQKKNLRHSVFPIQP